MLKPMRSIKSATTTFHLSDVSFSSFGEDNEQCQTGFSISGLNFRIVENSSDKSRGLLPTMLPPTNSGFFSISFSRRI
jgi:hypothetical protein